MGPLRQKQEAGVAHRSKMRTKTQEDDQDDEDVGAAGKAGGAGI